MPGGREVTRSRAHCSLGVACTLGARAYVCVKCKVLVRSVEVLPGPGWLRRLAGPVLLQMLNSPKCMPRDNIPARGTGKWAVACRARGVTPLTGRVGHVGRRRTARTRRRRPRGEVRARPATRGRLAT